MASSVFFWDLSTSRRAPFDQRLKRLLKKSGLGRHVGSGDLVALKVHFGEQGTTGFIAPIWIRPIVDFVRKNGGRPFLTDTNTLYVGNRGESVSHTLQAAQHGFDPYVTGAPVIIADGLKSGNEEVVFRTGKHFSELSLARDIVQADAMVTLSHFKGHELAGFGGALKNLGMGCATRKGKMQQHCGLGPEIHPEHCTGCGNCIEVCSAGALSLDESGKVVLAREKCLGCAACFLACRHQGLKVDWKVDVEVFLERMAEYAAAVLESMKRPVLHLNFVLQVSPGCDCVGYTEAPLCPDLGVLASYDPVALDQAALDLVNQAPSTRSGVAEDQDKFQEVHAHTRGSHLLACAQDMGLGSRSYQLVRV